MCIRDSLIYYSYIAAASNTWWQMRVIRLTRTYTTHIRFPFSGFFWDNPGELVPEETLTHPHLSWSSVIPYLLPLSITIHGILPVQFTCLTVFLHNLWPSFLWSTSRSGPSTSYSIHFFTQSLSSFLSTCPYHRNLLCSSTEIISPNPSLSLKIFTWNSIF